MTTLSKDPYKGTRDWYPEDMRVREYIFSTWKNVMRKHGYEAYDAPLIEPLEVYAAKSGEELVSDQTYQFIDRGERHVAIRPELTPSVSRMVAGRRQELAYPARWYNVGQFMRYERPQKGREREFWQMNVDIFGVDGVAAEAEIITIGARIMQAFGAQPSMYTIQINNRRVIDFVMREYLLLDTVQANLMIKLFDRKNKISHEAFRDTAIDILGDKAKDGLKKITKLVSARSIDELPKEITQTGAFSEITTLFERLKTAGVKNAQFDIMLMRGLDYYTGTVFEVFDTNPDNARAIFGGGRYDGLVGLFGVPPLSAVGMAPGLSMFEIFLKGHKLLPEFVSRTDVYMVVFPGAEGGALKLADELRDEDINVEIDITGRKVDKQLKTAVKKSIPYILFIGENELKEGVFAFKNTRTMVEEKLSPQRIVSTVRDYRHRDSDADKDEFDV